MSAVQMAAPASAARKRVLGFLGSVKQSGSGFSAGATLRHGLTWWVATPTISMVLSRTHSARFRVHSVCRCFIRCPAMKGATPAAMPLGLPEQMAPASLTPATYKLHRRLSQAAPAYGHTNLSLLTQKLRRCQTTALACALMCPYSGPIRSADWWFSTRIDGNCDPGRTDR